MNSKNPFTLFEQFMQEAQEAGEKEPTAMNLATVNSKGVPSSRIVLLKSIDESGLVFYTHENSPKGRDISANPHVALCFYWTLIDKQVRIAGRAELVAEHIADQYFAGRPRMSQIGAWASKQSEELESREIMENKFSKYEKEYADKKVLRPKWWKGYKVVPDAFEFWVKGDYRLHDRCRFESFKESNQTKWNLQLLYP